MMVLEINDLTWYQGHVPWRSMSWEMPIEENKEELMERMMLTQCFNCE